MDEIPLDLWTLSKMKRQIQQFNPFNQNSFNPKRKCYKRSRFVWIQDLNYNLIIIENDNPLSTIKETIIAFQAKHPNLDLTFQETS